MVSLSEFYLADGVDNTVLVFDEVLIEVRVRREAARHPAVLVRRTTMRALATH
jgi:hypothetical protein